MFDKYSSLLPSPVARQQQSCPKSGRNDSHFARLRKTTHNGTHQQPLLFVSGVTHRLLSAVCTLHPARYATPIAYLLLAYLILPYLPLSYLLPISSDTQLFAVYCSLFTSGALTTPSLFTVHPPAPLTVTVILFACPRLAWDSLRSLGSRLMIFGRSSERWPKRRTLSGSGHGIPCPDRIASVRARLPCPYGVRRFVPRYNDLLDRHRLD
jgi:hypothetical protein